MGLPELTQDQPAFLATVAGRVHLQTGKHRSFPGHPQWTEMAPPGAGGISPVNQYECTSPKYHENVFMHKVAKEPFCYEKEHHSPKYQENLFPHTVAEWEWAKLVAAAGGGGPTQPVDPHQHLAVRLDAMPPMLANPQRAQRTTPGYGQPMQPAARLRLPPERFGTTSPLLDDPKQSLIFATGEENCSISTTPSTSDCGKSSLGNASSPAEDAAQPVDRDRLIKTLCTLGVEEDSIKDLGTDALLNLIPRGPQGELRSAGSLLHGKENTTCKPCVLWFQNKCSNDFYCTYCHIAHEGQKVKRIRPSKSTRLREKQPRVKLLGPEDFIHLSL